MHVHVNKR